MAQDNSNTQRSHSSQRKHLEVFGIKQRGEQSYWTRIGVAFVNRDGSLSVQLEFIPSDPDISIHIREPRAREEHQDPDPQTGEMAGC